MFFYVFVTNISKIASIERRREFGINALTHDLQGDAFAQQLRHDGEGARKLWMYTHSSTYS